MPKNIKLNISDRILAATFLKLLPEKVTPNQITIFRFFAVPFIALLFWLDKFQVGAAVFVIAAFSDALDGALARTKNKITRWGITYDPLADKLLIGITAFLILPEFLGPWIVFAMIFLEMIILGMGYYNSIHRKGRVMMANWWGKSKMISQFFGVFLVIIYVLWPIALLLTIAQFILYLSIVLAAISIITYSL